MSPTRLLIKTKGKIRLVKKTERYFCYTLLPPPCFRGGGRRSVPFYHNSRIETVPSDIRSIFSERKSRPSFSQYFQIPYKTNNMASNIVYSIVWFLLLVFITLPVAWFCSWWWCVLIAFESLFPFIKDCADFLEKIITWPRVVGSACIRGDSTFPTPW